MKIGLGLVVVCLLGDGLNMVSQAHRLRGQVRKSSSQTHYAKYELSDPDAGMGAKLFVSVYTPQVGAFKDAGPYSVFDGRGTALLTAPPYGEDKGAGAAGAEPGGCWESGYIFVCADARGRYESEGPCFRR